MQITRTQKDSGRFARRPQERSENMRAGIAGALLLLSGLVALSVGCSRKPPTPPPCPPPFLTNEKRQEDVYDCTYQGECAKYGGECVDNRCTKSGICTRDADCRSGFCDRGLCLRLFGPVGGYGAQCEPLPPPEERPKRPPGWIMKWGPEDECGNYLCIDRRCRSCQSDAECDERSTCNTVKGFPGKLCWTAAAQDDPEVLDPHPRSP
jgi:hypothetical protein